MFYADFEPLLQKFLLSSHDMKLLKFLFHKKYKHKKLEIIKRDIHNIYLRENQCHHKMHT